MLNLSSAHACHVVRVKFMSFILLLQKVKMELLYRMLVRFNTTCIISTLWANCHIIACHINAIPLGYLDGIQRVYTICVMARKVILIKQYRCKIIVLLELKWRGRDFVGLEQTNFFLFFPGQTKLNIKKSNILIILGFFRDQQG